MKLRLSVTQTLEVVYRLSYLSVKHHSSAAISVFTLNSNLVSGLFIYCDALNLISQFLQVSLSYDPGAHYLFYQGTCAAVTFGRLCFQEPRVDLRPARREQPTFLCRTRPAAISISSFFLSDLFILPLTGNV